MIDLIRSMVDPLSCGEFTAVVQLFTAILKKCRLRMEVSLIFSLVCNASGIEKAERGY